MNHLPIGQKHFARRDLGEKVGELLERFDWKEFKFGGMRPEPVKSGQEILGAIGDPMILGEEERALIVFKRARSDGSVEMFINIQGLQELSEKALHGEKDLESRGKGGVLGFKSREANVRNELRFPENWTAAHEQDVPHARLGRVGVARILHPVQSAVVGVDIEIQVEATGGAHDHAEVSGAL